MTLITVALRLERIHVTLEALSVPILSAIAPVNIQTSSFSQTLSQVLPSLVVLLKHFIDFLKVLFIAVIFYLLAVIFSD